MFTAAFTALAQPGPVELQPGSPVTVNLTGSSPVELVFAAQSPQTITLTAHSLDGSVDTTLKLFTPDGRLLAENDDLANGTPALLSTDSVIQNLELAVPGPYRIVVDSFTGIDSGAVEVLLESQGAPANGQVAPLPGSLQPVPTDVKYIIPGSPMRIYVPGEALDFLLILEGGGSVTISANRLDAVFDPLLQILGPQGRVLAENDDADSGTRNARIADWRPPNPGVYTVRLSSFTNTDVGKVELLVEIR
jgi:serine protease Do